METKTYQGWTNYETWAVKLWFDNDWGIYRFLTDASKTIWEKVEPCKYHSKEGNFTHYLSKFLKEHVEEFKPKLENTMYSDLMNYAIQQVNFREIAESYLADLKETAKVQTLNGKENYDNEN